jgi:hypothetical protein
VHQTFRTEAGPPGLASVEHAAPVVTAQPIAARECPKTGSIQDHEEVAMHSAATPATSPTDVAAAETDGQLAPRAKGVFPPPRKLDARRPNRQHPTHARLDLRRVRSMVCSEARDHQRDQPETTATTRKSAIRPYVPNTSHLRGASRCFRSYCTCREAQVLGSMPAPVGATVLARIHPPHVAHPGAEAHVAAARPRYVAHRKLIQGGNGKVGWFSST